MRQMLTSRFLLGTAAVLAVPAFLLAQTAPGDSDLYCAGFFTTA
jgi:hypothetical protein